MELQGKTAMVTGGAVRVGRAISLALARAGARVIIHYNSSAEAAQKLVGGIRQSGGEASEVGGDLSDPIEIERVAAFAEAEGPVDLLVNNASVFPADSLESVDVQTWDHTIAINLRAPFFLTQRIGTAMKRRGAGVIINIADLSGLQTWSGYAAHSVAKAGLLHLTRIAARSLAPEVRVNAIAPGTVLPPTEFSAEEVEKLARRAPLKRNGSPADVADAVIYLARAEFVTGEVIIVDGGRHLG